jgi:hypothetical protein
MFTAPTAQMNRNLSPKSGCPFEIAIPSDLKGQTEQNLEEATKVRPLTFSQLSSLHPAF